MFENVVVQDSNSNTTKEFRDVSIEVAGKEIYIGSNYKVKWKHMTSLKCKNNVDNIDIDDEDEDDEDFRDADYARAGFVLICTKEDKRKSKSKQQQQPQRMSFQNDDDKAERRTFWVRFPIPPEGHRLVGTLWEAFRKVLEGGSRKELHKRQKKLDKEERKREEELLQQQQELRDKKLASKTMHSRGNTTSRTYSKRPYDFMRKNAANIANNAEVWTDDEDETVDNNITATATVTSPVGDTTPELVPVDEDEVATEDDEGGGVGFGVGDDDESEHEFGEDNSNSNSNTMEDDTSVDLMETLNHNELEDDDEDSVVLKKSLSSSSKTRRIIKRRGPVLDDSEDEDDNLFQTDAVGMTKPTTATAGTTVQRVVTPKESRRFLDDDNDGANDGKGKVPEQETEQDRSDDEEASAKNTKKINSFFQPRPPKTNDATNLSLGDTDRNGDASQDSGATESESESESDLLTKNNVSHKEKNEATPEASILPKSKNTTTFFAPRSKIALGRQKTKTPMKNRSPMRNTRSPMRTKRRTPTTTKRILDDDLSDSDGETSTVVADTKDDEIMDDGDHKAAASDVTMAATTPSRSPSTLRAHTPKQSRMQFEIVRSPVRKAYGGKTTRSIEEEDPIENADSSQSQSQSPSKKPSSILKRSASRFSSGRLKKRRLRINTGSKSALEALEFADTKKQQYHLSPISTSRRPNNRDDVVSAANTVTAVERSPIQPLKLGPQVELAATEYNHKWRGFRNDGNSCYVNSSLQQLFSVPKFMQAISDRTEEGGGQHKLAATLSDLYADVLVLGDDNDNSDSSAGESASGKIGRETTPSKTASARPVKKAVDRLTKRFHGYQQQDAHEFLGELIDQIHEEFSPPPPPLNGNEGDDNESTDSDSGSGNDDKSESPGKVKDSCCSGARGMEPTDEFFRWNVQVCLECKTCGYSR